MRSRSKPALRLALLGLLGCGVGAPSNPPVLATAAPPQAVADHRAEASAEPASSSEPALAMACESDGQCGIDAEHTACAAPGPESAPWIASAGEAVCTCSHGQCVRLETEPAPCESHEQCGSASLGAFTVPVRLAKRRPRKLKPCAGDGAHIPQCVEHRCVVAVYKC